MNDEQAIRWLKGLKANEILSATREALDIAIQSIEIKRSKGEWEEGTQGYYCSKCDYYDQFHFEHNFCPSCGADMRGEENEVQDKS